MKRIIFTVINDLVYDQRMQRICSSLSHEGFDITLAGRKLPNSPPLKEMPYHQHRIKCLFTKGKLFYLFYNIRLFFFLLFRKYDAACAIDLDTILAVWAASRTKSKLKMYDAHEYFPEVPEVTHRPGVKKIWQAIEKFSIPRMDHCYTVSQSLVDVFEKKYGKKFHLIRNVPLKKELKTTHPFLKKTILYLGAVNEGRGLEELTEAMAHIDARLIIAGDGDIFDKIKELIRQHKVEDKVEMTGYVSPERMYELSLEASIGYNLLNPASKSYYYSLSNKFFAYVHAGIPSISSDFPEYRKLNQSYRVCELTDLNVKNIVDSASKLLTDEGLYQQYREQCLLAREAWNWQMEEKKLTRLYHEW